MKKGGVGGSLTKTGIKFEQETDLESALIKAGLSVEGHAVYYDNENVGLICSQYRLYSQFLRPRDIDWKQLVSKRLLPDEAYFSSKNNSLVIIEKKYQQVAGSVDEKLQTIGFKIRQYKKLTQPLNLELKFIYVLNDWFKDPRYKDSLEYIKECGGLYFFNEIPLEELGF